MENSQVLGYLCRAAVYTLGECCRTSSFRNGSAYSSTVFSSIRFKSIRFSEFERKTLLWKVSVFVKQRNRIKYGFQFILGYSLHDSYDLYEQTYSIV